MAEMHRDKDVRSDPYTIEEFIPGAVGPDDGISPGEKLFNKMRLYLAMTGGEDLTAGMNIQFLDHDQEN